MGRSDAVGDGVTGLPAETGDHLAWVNTRMSLERELKAWIRHGFALIAVGFGSFAFLEGLIRALGEGHNASVTEPSRVFSLVVTAVGVAVIAVALHHSRLMTDFVDSDVFGTATVPRIPHERWNDRLASAAMGIGVVSFVALLLLR